MLLLQENGSFKAEWSTLKGKTERGDHKGGDASVVADVEDFNNQRDIPVIADNRINSTND